MRLKILIERREFINFLAMLCAEARSHFEVFTLDVNRDNRLIPVQQIGNDRAHTFPRARGRDQHGKLRFIHEQILAAEFAQDQTLFLEKFCALRFACRCPSSIPMQAARLAHSEQNQ